MAFTTRPHKVAGRRPSLPASSPQPWVSELRPSWPMSAGQKSPTRPQNPPYQAPTETSQRLSQAEARVECLEVEAQNAPDKPELASVIASPNTTRPSTFCHRGISDKSVIHLAPHCAYQPPSRGPIEWDTRLSMHQGHLGSGDPMHRRPLLVFRGGSTETNPANSDGG
ncbi:uncharacterized protein B0I36DRAFT_347158 [Microdochium trichocladiopsis]|uniref:Uncharacterized protein n=1 Tax=Microdochium trichocladiopsis TaxID=1682393 RepID=A0A9P8YBC5_9PEZI|nr:uncharacterized protein B0I36DRAFT_347158 [Microdochium trichocladiopsis]KAH7035363.1 hypothetical protein B0I36DRAFT_347158 [Microdochium trichocladiopsis]